VAHLTSQALAASSVGACFHYTLHSGFVGILDMLLHSCLYSIPLSAPFATPDNNHTLTVEGVHDADLTIGADGHGFVSYHDEGGTQLKIAHCLNTKCTDDGTAVVDSGGDTGQYPSVTTGVDGLPLMSYYGGTNANLRATHCANLMCVSYQNNR